MLSTTDAHALAARLLVTSGVAKKRSRRSCDDIGRLEAETHATGCLLARSRRTRARRGRD
jgi:hypothetical protein